MKERETNFEAHEQAKTATTLASGRHVRLSVTPGIMHVNHIIEHEYGGEFKKMDTLVHIHHTLPSRIQQNMFLRFD